MKKIFLAFALTAFVCAASINTVSAFVSAPAAMLGGEECTKGKKCKKTDACCKTKTAANNDKKCSKGEKKCCSHSAVKPAATSQVKPEPKTTEVVK